jgi:hypothetical protein
VFESVEDLNTAWVDLERLYTWSVLDGLNTAECDELFLILDTARHNGTAPDMGEITEHVQGHRACFEHNAWVLEA